jgi:hypothetical protein
VRGATSHGHPRINRIPIVGMAAGATLRAMQPSHTDQTDELAPLHSITSSARAISDGATVRPSALAALALIASSYRVGF